MKAVKLLRRHEHAGVEHPAGVTITVSSGTARYLEEHGIGKAVINRNPKKGVKP